MCLTSSDDFKALRQKLESVRRGKGSASRLFGCKTATSTLARNCSLPAGPAGFRFTNPHNNRAEFLKLSLSLSLPVASVCLSLSRSVSLCLYISLHICVCVFVLQRKTSNRKYLLFCTTLSNTEFDAKTVSRGKES